MTFPPPPPPPLPAQKKTPKPRKDMASSHHPKLRAMSTFSEEICWGAWLLRFLSQIRVSVVSVGCFGLEGLRVKWGFFGLLGSLYSGLGFRVYGLFVGSRTTAAKPQVV